MKLRLFIGSSVAHLPIADALQKGLDHDADVTVWPQGVFEPSKTTLESLLAHLDRTDYGVFVLAPEDLVKIRGKKVMTARDNVVFELGLFIGRLGRERSVIVTPQGHDLHLPTDLLGITPATYDAIRAAKDPLPSLGPACTDIRALLAKHTTGIASPIKDGFRLSLSARHSIDLVSGAIQKASPDPKYGAVVLPANTAFDDACIDDDKSALGAFFQTHFRSQISHVRELMEAELKKIVPGIENGRKIYPAGTAIYLDHPLKTKHRIIITGVTEKIADAGILADTLSLIASLKNVLRLAADKRLTELWMPVMGTGHGGLDFSVALSMILLQLDHGFLHGGFHSIERVVIVVHDPDRKRDSQIERLAKAYPLLTRA